jgi:hypothetical protein
MSNVLQVNAVERSLVSCDDNGLTLTLTTRWTNVWKISFGSPA